MLKLNVNQEKQLNFEIQIGGVQSDQLSSFLRIEIDEIEYGFPAQVGRESVTVNLPALKTVTPKRLKEGKEVNVKLEIIADDHYLTPWRDTFILSNPLVVEAKIVDDDFNPPPTFKTKLITKGDVGDRAQAIMVEKTETEEEAKEEEVSLITETEEEMTERIFNNVVEKFTSLAKGRSTKKVIQESDPTDKPDIVKNITTEEVKNIDEEGVYEYMVRAGTKNKKIQKLIYEQAEIAAGTSIPVEVLKHVVKILKKKK